MSSTTFVTVTMDEIQSHHEQHWLSALEALKVPAENDDAKSRISPVMPYARAYRAYTDHLEDCEGCEEGTLWEQCPEGDRLSGLAADAMAAQEDLALQN
jgi:hypothetical protein